jgi:hypothetical protein
MNPAQLAQHLKHAAAHVPEAATHRKRGRSAFEAPPPPPAQDGEVAAVAVSTVIAQPKRKPKPSRRTQKSIEAAETKPKPKAKSKPRAKSDPSVPAAFAPRASASEEFGFPVLI